MDSWESVSLFFFFVLSPQCGRNTEDFFYLSAKCNRSKRYSNLTVEEERRLVWHRWDEFFSRYFKPVRGIGKYHHFGFSSEEPGVVFAKVGLGDVEKRIPLLKDQLTLSDVLEGTTEVIIPAGLLVERKKYLDAEIRPFVQAEFRDSFRRSDFRDRVVPLDRHKC